jgi:hypothetical protein
MNERILLIHWAPEPDVPIGACGEDLEVTLLEGQNKHYRHAYVTLSIDQVNCKKCCMVLSFRALSKLKL